MIPALEADGHQVVSAQNSLDTLEGDVAALAPDADETSQSLRDKFPATEVFAHIEVADGRS